MALINQPPNSSVDQIAEENILVVNTEWRNYFGAVTNILTAVTGSGTTANRPTKLLWVGRGYFDTSLGIPIFYNGTVWINSAGTPV